MRRISAGFTLVEVLACLLLFSLGVMAVVAVITQGLTTATRAQSEATAWATAMSVLKDPLPMGGEEDPATGLLARWNWNRAGSTWTATEGVSPDAVWSCTTWGVDQPSDVLVSDMGSPVAGNPLVFPPGGSPAPGCAHGWINGYYVERREQSRASDRIGRGVRLVEVRVDVYWAKGYSNGSRALASAVDRHLRQEAP